MERHVSKVYINPNFNRATTSSVVPKPSVFHVNPAFSQVKQHTQTQVAQVTQQKSRIYINPNFMPSTPHVSHYNMASTNHSEASGYLSTPASAIETASVPELPPPISQSRYSLVRKEQKHPLPMKTNETADKPKTTIRLSKYKSITITDVKKRLEVVPPKITEHLEVQRKIEQLPKKYNSYKLLRTNSKSVNKENVSNQSYKKSVNSKKYFLASRSKYKLSKTAANNKMKKNNIPCPLFRKYGKCIRIEQGKCSFLHDKKHVSICRKFLKGLCFDVDCLLSHDLTSKKMPTCHFYLKGACSKDDCPYLHIKHNENTSICADFLKGYCEKGIECSKRHIDLCPDLATKGICSKSRCPYPHKSKTLKRNANQRKSFPNKVNRIKQPAKNKATKNPDLHRIEGDNTESRYYQESEKADNKDVCEIKPSRCKLGTLPSFIQL